MVFITDYYLLVLFGIKICIVLEKTLAKQKGRAQAYIDNERESTVLAQTQIVVYFTFNMKLCLSLSDMGINDMGFFQTFPHTF